MHWDPSLRGARSNPDCSQVPIRSYAFVPIVLSVSSSAQLHLSFHNRAVIDGLTLVGLVPADHWKLGFSARTGGAQPDLYAVDNMRVLQLHGDRPVTIAVDTTLNLQDFSQSTVTYEYVPSPLVSR